MFRLATVQSAVSADVRQNGRAARASMQLAAQAGARLVHFPECALSGYVETEIRHWSQVDWPALQEELDHVADHARRLGIWVVLGANHRLARSPHPAQPISRWPQNSLYVISDQGVVAGRYAKRLCSNTELTYWYTPGKDPLTFEVDGTSFGCALCIEVVFPHLFAEYERLGVQCMLLSSYSHNPMQAIMARAHAATYCYWLSLATPVACSPTNPTTLFGPDGSALAACQPARPNILVHTLDPDADDFRVPLRLARPWRALARQGQLHTHATAT